MPERNDNNKDFIDRKIDGGIKAVETSFTMATKDLKTWFIVILTILALVLIRENYRLVRESKKDTEEWSKIVIDEVRKQVPGAVHREVKEQIKPIAESVDTAKTNIEQFIERVSK